MPLDVAVVMALVIIGSCAGVLAWGAIALFLHSTANDLWCKSKRADWLTYLFFPIRAVCGTVGNSDHRLFEVETALREAMFLAWPVFIIWNAVFVTLLLPVRLWQVTHK